MGKPGIEISLEMKLERIILTVRDDVAVFATRRKQQRHGLRIMHYRAE